MEQIVEKVMMYSMLYLKHFLFENLSLFGALPRFSFLSFSGFINEEFAEEELVTVNWLEELSKGGITIIFLSLLSIFGLAVLIERLFAIRKSKFISKTTWDEIDSSSSTKDLVANENEFSQRTDLFSKAVVMILNRRSRSYQQVSDNVSDYVGREVRGHLGKIQLLSAVAGVAPLLGLLGTMIGMIESFKLVSVYGDEGGASILADSISKALITTAAGLVVAIPTLAAFYWMRHKVMGIATDLEVGLDQVLVRVYGDESSVNSTNPKETEKPQSTNPTGGDEE